MPTRAGALSVFVVAGLAACSSGSDRGNTAATPDAFLDRLTEATQTKDRAALVALVNWEGVSDDMRTSQEGSIDMLIDYEVVSVAVDPLPATFKRRHVRNGLVYRPNVEVEGMLKIMFGADRPPGVESLSMPFGLTDEGYFVAGVVTEPTELAKHGDPGPEDVSLNVSIVGVSAPDPVEFTGHCSFFASGEEFSESFEGSGNLSKAFWGQYMKKCTVQRTSGAGWIQLRILANGEDVFTSDRVASDDPIVYEMPSP